MLLIRCLFVASAVFAVDARAVGVVTESQAGGAADSSSRAINDCLDAGEAALAAGDKVLAAAKAQEALSLLRARDAGARDQEWVDLYTAVGLIALSLSDFELARTTWSEALEVAAAILAADHKSVTRLRLNLAVAHKQLGDLRAARVLEEQVLEVRERTLPEDHPDLVRTRSNLAGTIFKLGDIPAARAQLEKVLAARERTLGAEHKDVLLSRINLAAAIKAQGEVSAARDLELSVLEVQQRTLPPDDPNLQTTRSNLANSLRSLGRLDEAWKLEEIVLEVLTRTHSADHPEAWRARMGAAETLRARGDLQRARQMQENVLETLERVLPVDHPDRTTALMNLAATVQELGDLAGARVMHERVLEACSRTLPSGHPLRLMASGNLLKTMLEIGEFDRARERGAALLAEAEKVLPPGDRTLEMCRDHLGVALFELGDFQGARDLFETSVENASAVLPEDDPNLQMSRSNLAAALGQLGEREAARALWTQIVTSARASERPDQSVVRSSHFSLALTTARIASGDPSVAPSAQDRASFRDHSAAFLEAALRTAFAAYASVSPREAEERCNELAEDLDRALILAEGAGVFPPDPDLERTAFALSEVTRSAALTAARLARDSDAGARHAELRATIAASGEDLARLAQSGADSRALDDARVRRERAERELAGLVGERGGEIRSGVAAISERLGEHDAAVGFRVRWSWKFTPDGPKPEQRSAELCAHVLRSGDRLHRVDLGPVAAIEAAVAAWRDAVGVDSARGLADAADSTDRTRRTGVELRRLVVDPLLPHLEGVQRLVLALDGVLHLVPIDGLPLGDVDEPFTGSVGDRWRVEVRAGLLELTRRVDDATTTGALVAIGGASFNREPLAFVPEPVDGEEVAAIAEEAEEAPSAASRADRGFERAFEPLTFTRAEVRGLAALHDDAFESEGPAVVIEGREASRESLVALAPRARWLHVATHGWYGPNSVRAWTDITPSAASPLGPAGPGADERARGLSPMLLCGLALAGANLEADAIGRLPGVITAEEISTLDLERCELAVLSACDTNVGRLSRAGQGVASLQKSLHMAGARSVVTSLWKVPDEATKDLMLDFYRRIWIQGKPKGVALWESKRRLRDARDEQGRPVHSVRDWAGWVLTGEAD